MQVLRTDVKNPNPKGLYFAQKAQRPWKWALCDIGAIELVPTTAELVPAAAMLGPATAAAPEPPVAAITALELR